MMKKIKKEIKKVPKKILTFMMIIAILFSYFAPIINVVATASTTKLSVSFRNGNEEYGKVQYSLNDGASWNDVNGNTSLENLNVMGDNLKLKIVPNNNYSVDYAGIEISLDGNKVDDVSNLGLETENGYSVPSNVQSISLTQVEFKESNITSKVTIQINGEELEYDSPWSNDATSIFFGINNSPEMRGLDKDEVNYIVENNRIVGLDTKNAIDYEYDYNNEGTVTFHIKHQPGDIITSLKINNVSYSTPNTKNKLIQAYSDNAIMFDVPGVPYQESYDIEIQGRPLNEEEEFIAGFSWTYDENTNEYSDDDKILHGVLEFVKAEYGNEEYTTIADINEAGKLFSWNDGIRGTDDPTGEAVFPKGTILTLRLIPDSGYQLTSFDLNGFPFEPKEEVGLYTFTTEGGPFHLGAHFTEVSDEVQANSRNIKSGNIDIDKSEDASFESGTAKLEVNDVVSMSPSRMEEFKSTATERGYELENYLDISLYNSIYKGGNKDASGNYESWDTPVDNIEDKAKITLELENDMSGKELALIHEKHNGNTIVGYELITAIYNEEDNTITFETDSFSNYAIVSKESTNNTKIEKYTLSDDNGNTISFAEDKNKEFSLNIIDYLTFSEKDLEDAEIPKEMYDEVLETITNATKNYGTLLSFYEIEVKNENGNLIHEGPFNIKIKMTEEMKKYNTFKIIYVDTDNDFKIEEPITLTQDGEYLVGTLKHLSTYALTGSYVAPEENVTIDNPKTKDNIYMWVGIFLTSALGLSVCTISTIKIKKSKVK